MVKDDLLQKQFDKGWAKAIPNFFTESGRGAPDTEPDLLQFQLSSLRHSWEIREVRHELLASVPENCPPEYVGLIRDMKHTEEKLAGLGINDNEPTVFQAKKDLEQRKRETTALTEQEPYNLFVGRAYWEETVCYFVRDLKQLEIEVRWVASSEYQQEKQRLEKEVLPFFRELEQRHHESPSFREFLQSFLGMIRNEQRREQALKNAAETKEVLYQMVLFLTTITPPKSTLYYLINPNNPLSTIHLDWQGRQIYAGISTNTKNNYYMHCPSGLLKEVELSDMLSDKR